MHNYYTINYEYKNARMLTFEKNKIKYLNLIIQAPLNGNHSEYRRTLQPRTFKNISLEIFIAYFVRQLGQLNYSVTNVKITLMTVILHYKIQCHESGQRIKMSAKKSKDVQGYTFPSKTRSASSKLTNRPLEFGYCKI